MKTNTLQCFEMQTLANSLWAEYCEIFPKLVKFDCPTIKLNGRFTKTAGCNYSEENRIDLASKFLAKFRENMFKVILPHEIAHQIDFNLNVVKKGQNYHGKNWQIIMIKIGQKPNTYHSMVL